MHYQAYNAALDADSYKPSMYVQYPPNTTRIFDYIEARGSSSKPSDETIESLKKFLSPEMLKLFIAENTKQPFHKTVFSGLQPILIKYLSSPITPEMVEYAAQEWAEHGEPFNKEGWMRIATEFNGRIPLHIRAVPEGTVVPLRNALITIECLHDDFEWLVTHFETMLLRVWYPITISTLSAEIRRIIKGFLIDTADNLDGLDFKHHDFGSRGVSSMESAEIGGAAHMIAGSRGTDNMVAIQHLRTYYAADSMPAFSIPAAEHSTITSWTRECEIDAYRNMLRQFGKPGKMFAVVIDSYNYREAVKMWGTILKDELIASGATLVLRPDSGVPKYVVLEVMQLAELYFGTTLNTKGYKMLPSYVRVLQGDGITLETIPGILQILKDNQYSTDNLAMGQGGGLLQMVNRDTLQFACKCSAALVNGEWRDVYKDPIGDSGKRSKRGRLSLYRHKITGEYVTLRLEEADLTIYEDAMVTVFYDGGVFVEDYETIRARAVQY